MDKTPIKMTPGDDMHLTLLMAPHSLNFVTGQDRQHLLAFGRAAFEAGQKCQGSDKDQLLLVLGEENKQARARIEELEAQLAARVPLSIDRLARVADSHKFQCGAVTFVRIARAIEAAHGITQAKQGEQA